MTGIAGCGRSTPAIGGVAFYHPGDAETIVDLGCTDLAQLNDPTCTGESQVKVTAVVDDFDTNVSVQSSVADHLSLYMGDPIATIASDTTTHYQLPLGVNPLTRSTATTPSSSARRSTWARCSRRGAPGSRARGRRSRRGHRRR